MAFDFGPSNLWLLFKRCFRLLSKRDRFFYVVAFFIQLGLIALDLIGLLLVGAIIAIATSTVQGTNLPKLIETGITLLNIESFSPQRSAAILGVLAALLLVLKSLLSYFFGLKTFIFLSRREASISELLANRIFTLQITDLQKYSTSQYQHALVLGSNSVMTGVLGQTLLLVSELALQFAMLGTLFLFSPMLTIICIFFFFLLFFVLNKIQGEKARAWGIEMTRTNVLSHSLIVDAMGSYREITVNGRRDFFIEKIKIVRQKAANLSVKKNMLVQFSKYVFEISVVVSGLAISAFAFLTKPAIEAASLVAIFLTAAYRVAPSVLKLQQGVLQLKGAAGATELFFEIQSHLDDSQKRRMKSHTHVSSTLKNDPEIAVVLKDVSFTYPNRAIPALHSVNLRIPSHESLAIVGPSGAGKSTLVDVILGVIKPDSGEVLVHGYDPISLQDKRMMNTGYVPQSIHIANGTILDNICLGIEETEMDEELAWNVIKAVLLGDWVSQLEKGIHTPVGEWGSNLSGGQKQRIGIARALYQDPLILVLDEATSSLDAESEHEISKTIHALKSKLTVIVIAHRLSTVIDSDNILYMQNGEVIAQGSFDSLRDQVPDFDRQANLMGIRR